MARSRTRKAVTFVLVAAVALPLTAALEHTVAAVAPPAPVLAAPANGAAVTAPVTLSWSQVAGAGGYNWEIGTTSDFAVVLERNSPLLVGEATTHDVVGGLPNGTYFWHAQAVSPDVEASPWSAARSFTVTGAGAGSIGRAVLDPPHNATQFHTLENITFSWSAVPGAVSYVLQESTDPTFPIDTRVRQVGIPGPTEQISFNSSLQGNFKARVIAVDANGVMGAPSNSVDFSVLDANPFPAPPSLTAPANGAAQQLPVTLSWTDVPNHQDLGYQVQIASTSTFSTIEATFRVTENSKKVSALTTGTKFWRVRSQHGYIGANEAYTAFSATGSFTVQATPLRAGALTFPTTKFSGGEAPGTVELTGAAPTGGATVTFTSSNPSLVPELPQSRLVPAGSSSVDILVAPTGTTNSLRPMRVGFVTTATPVTVTATFNGTTASTTIMILPPALNDTPFQLFPQQATGGADMLGILDLEVGCFAGFCDGLAPAGGFPVSLSSSSPAATVPSTMTIPAGAGGDQFPITTSPVTAVTVVTITATAGGRTTYLPITLTPPPTPSTLTLDPVDTSADSRGIVTIPFASISGHDQLLKVTSSNPAVASVPPVMTIPAATQSGVFTITTSAVSARTVVTISVIGSGVTRTADLVVDPALPPLTGFSVNPTSVPGGTSSTGTVTLGSAAPAGGVAVSLSSSLPGSASVPASVTVPAGSTTASFTVTTFPVDNTTAQLTASLGGTTLFAALSITRAATVTLSSVTLSPTSVVGGTSSTGTVRLSGAAPSGGAVVALSDNSAAATTPASVTVPAGSSSRTFTVATSAVPSPTTVTVSGSYAGSSAGATLTVNPSSGSGTLPAPTLLTPAADARFNAGASIVFDWGDVAGATAYVIQIDDDSTFGSPIVNKSVAVSTFTTSTLPATRMWWRVRAVAASGAAGAWSSTRRFEVR